MLNRRLVFPLLGLVLPAIALAQGVAPANVDMAALLKPGPLGDRVLGKADAPVTIVEYASLTCSHCAAFHTETMPMVKEKLIETGKVRFIFREFPFDSLATAASMLARCTSEQRYFPLLDLFFKRQESWARSQKPLDELLGLARQAGFTQESFEACLKNQSVYEGINSVKQQAMDVYKVDSTPTFFVNGVKKSGNMSFEQVEKLIEPFLK